VELAAVEATPGAVVLAEDESAGVVVAVPRVDTTTPALPAGLPVPLDADCRGAALFVETRGAGVVEEARGLGLVVGGRGDGLGWVTGGGGATAGAVPLPKDQPSTDPGFGSYDPPPKLEYDQEPPREACQYDQYADDGGMLTHGSLAGCASIRQTAPGKRWTCVVEKPAPLSAASPLPGSPGAQRVTVLPPGKVTTTVTPLVLEQAAACAGGVTAAPPPSASPAARTSRVSRRIRRACRGGARGPGG
jgi:hypothetical protein